MYSLLLACMKPVLELKGDYISSAWSDGGYVVVAEKGIRFLAQKQGDKFVRLTRIPGAYSDTDEDVVIRRQDLVYLFISDAGEEFTIFAYNEDTREIQHFRDLKSPAPPVEAWSRLFVPARQVSSSEYVLHEVTGRQIKPIPLSFRVDRVEAFGGDGLLFNRSILATEGPVEAGGNLGFSRESLRRVFLTPSE